MEVWIDGWTDSPGFLQDFVPFRAAALLLNLNPTLLKQGTGTADHLLPLGCYLDMLSVPSLKSALSGLKSGFLGVKLVPSGL